VDWCSALAITPGRRWSAGALNKGDNMKLRDYMPLAIELGKEAAYNLGLASNDGEVKEKKQVLAAWKKEIDEVGVTDNILKAISLDEAINWYYWGITGKQPAALRKKEKAEADENEE